MSTTPRTVKQITIRPPIAPPTIAPRCNGSCLAVVEIGSGVEDAIEEFKAELELEVGMGDVSTTVVVGREGRLVKELLSTELKLDGVVVAATELGDGNSLSVRASAPQAMYSKD